MRINGLDDPSLLLIFDRLSVENLLRAGRVCSRWNTIRGKAALSRKSLTLLVGEDALKGIKKSRIRKIPHYKLLSNNENHANQIALHDVNEVMNNTQSQLQINSVFSNLHVNFLSQLFANVQHFTISCPGSTENIQLVNDLLMKWTAKLVTLKLYANNQDKLHITSRTVWPLLTTINSMASLAVVHFDVSPMIVPVTDQIEEEHALGTLEFVNRLTQFHFNADHYSLLQYLIDCMNMHVDKNQQLSDIAISSSRSSMPGTHDQTIKCIIIKPELAVRFSQIATTIRNVQTLEYLSKHFTNLTILNLDFTYYDEDSPLNANTFYRSLASLKQLIYLRTDNIREGTLSKLFVNPGRIRSRYGEDHMNSSIKVLQFGSSNDLSDHRMFEQLCLYHFFPRLEVFILARSGGRCDVCDEEGLSYEKYCLRRMLVATLMHLHCEVIKTTEPKREWGNEYLMIHAEADLVYSDGDEDKEESGNEESDNEDSVGDEEDTNELDGDDKEGDYQEDEEKVQNDE